MGTRELIRRVDNAKLWLTDGDRPIPDFLRELWRLSPPEMDGEDVVSEGMWEHQLEWWEMPRFIKLLVGGYGAGKTISLVRRMISLALLNDGCPVAMVSPTYEMARETTVRTTIELLDQKQEELGHDVLSYVHTKNEKRFDIRCGRRHGILLYYGGDNPDRLKGPNLAAAGIDEPFIQSYEVFKQIMARVRHPRAELREISLTGTPENLGWGWELCEGELGQSLDVGFVRAPTKANLALSRSYVEALTASMGEKEVAAYLEGEFVNLSSGTVYYSFDPSVNIVDEEMPAGAELGVGMDFNVNPMAHVVFWRTRDRIHVFYEREEPNADTEFVCDKLRERWPNLREAYPDPTGKRRQTSAPGGRSDFYYIQQARMRVNARPPGQPHRRDRYNAVNAALKARKLTFSPSCTKLKRYLSSYTYENMHKKDHDAMSHLLDALGYPVEYLMPVIRTVTKAFDPDR